MEHINTQTSIVDFEDLMDTSVQDSVENISNEGYEEIKESEPMQEAESDSLQQQADSKKDVVKIINGIKFYKKKDMLYKQYALGDIAIAANMYANSSSQCLALLPNTLEVERLVMSQQPKNRNFYELCFFSTKNNIRDYPLKLYFRPFM